MVVGPSAPPMMPTVLSGVLFGLVNRVAQRKIATRSSRAINQKAGFL